MKKLLPLLLASLLSACVTLPEQRSSQASIVAPLSGPDASYLASVMAQAIQEGYQDPPGTRLLVDAPLDDRVFSPVLIDRLQAVGYTIIDRSEPQMSYLRYQVGSFFNLPDTLFMRIMMNDSEITITFDRQPDGGLDAVLPITFRETGIS